jgi:hypothetical protein
MSLRNSTKAMLAAGTALVLSACNGWPGTLPYQEAANKPEPYATYAATAGQPVEFYAGNHRFLVLPVEANVRSARTQPVSSSAGVSVFAVSGDEAPYGVLFARGGDGRTHVVAPID